MSLRPRVRRKGHSMLELLVAAVVGLLVVVGGLLLFLSGARLSVKLQAGSQALRAGSTGVERMRLVLSEATAALLPTDTAPLASWPAAALGDPDQYLSQDGETTYATAIYISLPATRTMTFRTGATQTQAVSLPSRSSVTRGALIYRGDSDGHPASTNGTFLWVWSFENQAITAKTVLYRKLAATPGAVAFRRGEGLSPLVRYRLVQAEKDSYGQASSSLGSAPAPSLDTSDYALALLNASGSTVPSSTLPIGAGSHP
jgi:type II secretory pathway pseudopilin PulG